MISRTIHSVWLSNNSKPEQVRSCIERFSLINRDYQVRLWSLGDIFHHFDEIPDFFHEALDLKKWAFATDWARLAILHRYGGIYLDSDVMCHKPFDHLLDCAGFIGWESKELLGPHCLAADAKNPIIQDWLSLYHNRRFKLSRWVTDQTPMPTLITDFSVDHHGLRRDGRPHAMAGGFKVHTADLLTSRVNSLCIAEHLYHGGWLGHKDSSFADDLRRANSSFLRKPRTAFDRLLEALGRNPIEASYRKRNIAEQKKTLCLVDPEERSVPHVSYWHVGAVSRPNFNAGTLSSKPLVSVIVSALKGGLQIDQCLQALSRQTFRNNEIVIIDGGLPDSSRKICEEYASQDRNFKIFETTHGGPGILRNLGLEKISGDLVCFVDIQDSVTPDHIASLVNGFSGDTDLVVCDHEEASTGGTVLRTCHTGRMHGERDAAIHLLLTEVECHAWNKMFRRSVFDFEPFRFGSGWFGDFAFMPALIGSVRALSFTNALTYRRLQGPDSLFAPSGLNAVRHLDVIAAARHLIKLEPVFRPQYWSTYYDWKLVRHTLYSRWPYLHGISDPRERERACSQLAKFVNSEMPWWYETEFVRARKHERSLAKRIVEMNFVKSVRSWGFN